MGEHLSSFPFPSDDHRWRAIASLTASISPPAGSISETITHPSAALQWCVHSEPNLLMHLVTPSLGVGHQRDTILSMTAVRVQPTQQTQQSYLVVMGESKIEVARVAATLSHHRHPPPPY